MDCALLPFAVVPDLLARKNVFTDTSSKYLAHGIVLRPLVLEAATAWRSCSSRVVVHGLLRGSAVLSRSWALVLIQGFRSCPRPAHQLCLAEEVCDGHSQPGARKHPPRHRPRPWLLAWLVVFCLAVFRFCGWPLCVAVSCGVFLGFCNFVSVLSSFLFGCHFCEWQNPLCPRVCSPHPGFLDRR